MVYSYHHHNKNMTHILVILYTLISDTLLPVRNSTRYRDTTISTQRCVSPEIVRRSVLLIEKLQWYDFDAFDVNRSFYFRLQSWLM